MNDFELVCPKFLVFSSSHKNFIYVYVWKRKRKSDKIKTHTAFTMKMKRNIVDLMALCVASLKLSMKCYIFESKANQWSTKKNENEIKGKIMPNDK